MSRGSNLIGCTKCIVINYLILILAYTILPNKNLCSFHPFKCSFFSYSYGFGGASFALYEKMLQRPFDWTNGISRASSSIFGEQSTTIIREPKDEFLSFSAYDSLNTPTRFSHVDHISSINMQQRAENLMHINPTTNPPQLKTLKRKASDTATLDLDLSLKLSSKMDNEGTLENHEVDSNLSLSLCSSSNLSRRLREAKDQCEEHRKMTSTLDLTI